ncbi:MAG: large ribosomal subunit protein bL35 [Planctomycetota bacterium]|jgi:large subunit ribosomal protein L35
MPKNKSHKGLLKRVRVSKTGKVKLQRAFGRHLRSHKPGQKIRGYRRPKYAAGADLRRLRSLLGLKASAGIRKAVTATAAPAETPTES